MDDYLWVWETSPEIDVFLKGKQGEALKAKGIIQKKWINSVVLSVDLLDFINPTSLSQGPSDHKQRIIETDDPVTRPSFQLLPPRPFSILSLREIHQHFKYDDSCDKIIILYTQFNCCPLPSLIHAILHLFKHFKIQSFRFFELNRPIKVSKKQIVQGKGTICNPSEDWMSEHNVDFTE